MDRSFVSGEETLPFATDFAKSFLAFALAEAKSGPIADSKKEIDTWWRSERTFWHPPPERAVIPRHGDSTTEWIPGPMGVFGK